MDYMATYPKSYLCYYASNMILNIDSDAAYLVVFKARSRIADTFNLTVNWNQKNLIKTMVPTANSIVLVLT